jgi:spectinomycin phosphotransferase
MLQERFFEHLALVCRSFGVSPVQQPIPLRGGYVAYVHRIDSTDGTVYFSKTYDALRSVTAMIMPTLESISVATQWLANQPGLQQRLVAPCTTMHGHVLVLDDRFTTLLFAYVEGVTPRETPLTDSQLAHLVDTVARIHTIDVHTAALAAVPRERFAPIWFDDIIPAIDRIAISSHVLHALLCDKVAGLYATFHVFRALAHTLATMQHPMVLCHTDIHGYNVVINTDDVPVLIDWEGMMVAPPEHDLMFWTADERWQQICERYRLRHPHQVIDAQRLRYYMGRRLFEDMIQDIQRIEGETLDDGMRTALLTSLEDVSSELIAWGASVD